MAFFFARRRRPVTLLSLPPRPLPGRFPALGAAIALARLNRTKTLVAPFQETAARPRTTDRASPPAVFLILGGACRILERAHGSLAPGKLMPRRGLASSPGRSRSGSVQTPDSIANDPARPVRCFYFFFPPAAARFKPAGSAAPLASPLWVPEVSLALKPVSVMVGAIGRHHLLAARRPVGRQSGTLSGRHQQS